MQVPRAPSQASAGGIAFFKMALVTPQAGKVDAVPVPPARNASIRAWTQDTDLDDKLKAQAAKVTSDSPASTAAAASDRVAMSSVGLPAPPPDCAWAGDCEQPATLPLTAVRGAARRSLVG